MAFYASILNSSPLATAY